MLSALMIASICTNISFFSFHRIMRLSSIRIIYSKGAHYFQGWGTGVLFHDRATKFNFLYLAGSTYIHYFNLLKMYYLKPQLTKSDNLLNLIIPTALVIFH